MNIDDKLDEILRNDIVIATDNGQPYIKYADEAKKAIKQLITEARIDELNRLDHNKQMFGDWQQVIADRIAELEGKE